MIVRVCCCTVIWFVFTVQTFLEVTSTFTLVCTEVQLHTAALRPWLTKGTIYGYVCSQIIQKTMLRLYLTFDSIAQCGRCSGMCYVYCWTS